jgi:ABC-2 type transport system permease protein
MLRLRRMIRKEFLQLRQDPTMARIVFVAPVLQLLIFGYAVSFDVNNLTTAVCDLDRSPASRALVQRMVGSGYFRVVAEVQSPRELDRLLDMGHAQVAVSLPRGLQRELLAGQRPQVQALFDASDSNTAGVGSGYLTGVVEQFGQEYLAERMSRLAPGVRALPQVELRPRVWFNPELRSVDYMVPAVLAQILMVVTGVLMSLAVVREREAGTLEQLIVTPLRPWELIVGKLLPFVAIGFVDAVLVVLMALYWFHVPLRGSLFLLLCMTIPYLMNTLGMGLLISTVSRTQQQALMTAFFFLLPMVLLSGFIFPIANMPHALQVVTYALPLRYFLEIVRGIFLRGAGPGILWPQGLALLGLGTLLLGTAVWRFRKHLD